MATTLAQARKEVRALYGLAYSDSEDPLFTNNALTSLVNRAHYWLAGATRCYYNDALSISMTTTVQEYNLGETVIEPAIRTFTYNVSATDAVYRRLPWRTYESLLEQYGPLSEVAAGTPLYVTILPGDATAATKKVHVIPAPNFGSGTGTLKHGAWVYPAALSADGDTIYLPDPDIHRLYSAVCLQMAMFESSRGRQDAPVAMWAERAGVDAAELHRITRQATREPSRTAEVRESPMAGALERMRPSTIGS